MSMLSSAAVSSCKHFYLGFKSKLTSEHLSSTFQDSATDEN